MRTSSTSSTSDRGPAAAPAGSLQLASRKGLAGVLEGLIRIVHPFPSLLDGGITVALALVAGGGPAVALRLGAAMTLLQFAIGTANDLIDEPLDRGRKSGKPLPRGLLSRRAATLVFGGCAVLGLAFAAVSGLLVAAVGVVGLAVGLAYDVWLKRTFWSWLPFAVGIPVVPVFAWLGAVGRLPGAFAVLLPAAVLAGAALAIANLLADAERDRAGHVDNLVTRVGPDRANAAAVTLHVAVLVLAVGSLVAWQGRGVGILGVVVGMAAVVGGLVMGRRGAASIRERAWELQAAGVGLLAVGWVAAVAEAGAF